MSTLEDPRQLAESALPQIHTWSDRPTEVDLTPLPGCPAVFLFTDADGAPVQLLTTQQLKRVVISRLSEPDEQRGGKTDLAAIVRRVRWRQVHSPFEARWWYYQLARVLHPREYRQDISFGPAWFLNIDWSRPAPDPRVSERIWCQDGEFIGPWPTHKSCRQALEGLWDLFDLCRYPEQVRKAPTGTPCAYADMGRCDAPCDGSVTLESYTHRVREAWRFAAGEIESWIAASTARMKQAAAEQSFELAGLLKQQLDFARNWQRNWSPALQTAEQLNFLLLIPATRRKAWKPFLFRQGCLEEGPLISDRRLPTDAPTWLEEQLTRPLTPLDDTIRMEQTWLVAHFLRHKESRAALIVSLPELQVPAELTQTLQSALE